MCIIISENINGRIIETKFSEIRKVEPNTLSGGLTIVTMFGDKIFQEIDYENGDTWEILEH